LTFFVTGLFALFMSILLMPLLQKLAFHIGAVDRPNDRKVHSTPIPRIGGVLIAFSFVLCCLVFVPLTDGVRGLLVGSLLISALGLTDDLMGVTPARKFIAQWVIAGIFLAIARPEFCFPYPEAPVWISYPIACFLLVGLINAFNLQDGLDGLAAGLAVISALSLGMVLSYHGNSTLITLLVALVGAVIGFLRVNTWPAKIFMGDTGSYLLGFVLGGSLLLGNAAGHLPLWNGLFLFLLPILDTLQVLFRRVLRGRDPFIADRRHLHHMILDLGFAHQHVVFLEYVVASFFTLIPLLLLSPLRLRWFGLGLVGTVFCLFWLQYRNIPANTGNRNGLQLSSPVLRHYMKRTVQVVLACGLLAILAVQLDQVRGIGLKYGVLPTGLAIAYACWSYYRLRRRQEARLSMSLSLVVGAQLFIYHQYGVESMLHEGIWVSLGIVSAVVYLMRYRYHTVISNPIEYFLIFGSILLFYLPVSIKGSFRTDYLAIEMLSFYAIYRVSTGIFNLEENPRLPLMGALCLLLLVIVGMIRV